jgi:hypothetical protein
MATELFRCFEDFYAGKAMVNWPLAWEYEDSLDEVLEGIELTQHSLALLPDLDSEKRIFLLGSLAFIRTNLEFAVNVAHDRQRFMDLCRELEDVLKEIIVSFKIEQAEGRFEEFLAFTEEQEEGGEEPSAEQMIFFQPVFLALGVGTILNFDETPELLEVDEEEENEKHDEDEECSCEDEH